MEIKKKRGTPLKGEQGKWRQLIKDKRKVAKNRRKTWSPGQFLEYVKNGIACVVNGL